MSIEARLQELGLALPAVAKPVAAYVPAVESGNQVFVSGQLPLASGQLLSTGKVPSQVSVETAQQAARQCVLNGLAALHAHIGGDWNRLVRVVRIGAFVQSDNDFFQQSQVANGASELLQAILGDAGRHARAAVGVNALPLNAPVEVEFLFEIRK
ncbi:MAG TPA: RidA family protein [Pirellulales bacterium]